MRKKTKTDFRNMLNKYIPIKGIDIIVFMADGNEIELHKNRMIVKNDIIYYDRDNSEMRIPISKIKSIDLYAA